MTPTMLARGEVGVPSAEDGLEDYYPLNEQRSDANRNIMDRLSRDLTVRRDPSFGPLVRPSDEQEPVQRWFHYREGYTVELGRRIIQPDDTFVADPFCGFGSTLLAAQAANVPCAGTDVNPLATFVTRVKTRQYQDSLLGTLATRCDEIAGLSATGPTSPAPSLKILPKLFHPEILRALLTFQAFVDAVPNEDEREFLQLAWLAVLEDVSNVFREGNGLKYRNRRRRKNTYTTIPYEQWQADHFPADKFGFVRDALIAQLTMMIEDAGNLPGGPTPTVAQKSAAEIGQIAPRGGASLALFSPPYCNCFNYIKAYKLELWMGGFLKSYRDIRPLNAVGVRSRMESLAWSDREAVLPEVDEFLALMDPARLWSAQLPQLVRGYFADMGLILESLRTALRPGGRCVIVVGNSAYDGVLIPTDLLLARAAAAAGYEVEEIVVARPLTTSSQQKRALEPVKEYLRESLIHLRRVR